MADVININFIHLESFDQFFSLLRFHLVAKHAAYFDSI